MSGAAQSTASTSRRESERDRQGSLRVGVLGLWHLGCVTAACLAEHGFEVVGLDFDPEVVAELRCGRPPIGEPGLGELIALGQRSGSLRFDTPDGGSLGDLDILWIAFDTPVDDEDHADSEWVIERARRALVHLRKGVLVVVSSQLPVGSTARLAAMLGAEGREDIRFAYVPENLRLGHALASFRSPERIVVGVRDAADRDRLSALLEPFTDRVEWMGVESAEMTKHALNGFLATSITFINEIASLCECVGADASEVSRGLKSDARIGPRSYLSPGDAFAGGTLARDVSALSRVAQDNRLPAHLISGIAASNEAHREWARRALRRLFATNDAGVDGGGLSGKHVAMWGLTYKPGTDTLRRSAALELGGWLREQGATVRAHDPAITTLPGEAGGGIELCTTPLSAARQADAVVVCTAWPEYVQVSSQALVDVMRTPTVLDAAGHVQATLGSDPAIRYARVGTRHR
jgi:UDPglucose 6-dehydrogenase